MPTVSGKTAIVVGIGPSIGPAVARRLAAANMRLALVSRSSTRQLHLTSELRSYGAVVRPYSCDVTNEGAVRDLVAQVTVDLESPELVVYGVQGWSPGTVLETEVQVFEEAWRQNCLGAFVIGRECARAMLTNGRGTLVFLGSTSGTVGRPGYLNLVVGKFGLRALSQVMARELGPSGIHVVHIVIDADVSDEGLDPDPRTRPEDLADLVLSLHSQPRSAWTHELDVRPFREGFWEHC